MNDAILPGMDGQLQVSNWIESAKRRGQVPFLLTVLDVIEPIAPALAQGLLVAQPLASFWPGAAGVRELAERLEEPDGIRILRQQLSDDALE